MFKKARSPARGRFGGARSSKAAGHLAGGAYKGVREHDKGPTRLRKIAIAGRERMLACRPKLKRRLAGFFNILLSEIGG
jgi:hypothetical protein